MRDAAPERTNGRSHSPLVTRVLLALSFFADRDKFLYFTRTTSNMELEAEALVSIIHHYGWKSLVLWHRFERAASRHLRLCRT
jgi:hypothetical protein